MTMRCRCGYGLSKVGSRDGWARPLATIPHGRPTGRTLYLCAAEACTPSIAMARSFGSSFTLMGGPKLQPGRPMEAAYALRLTQANTARSLCGKCPPMAAAYTQFLRTGRLLARVRETGRPTANTSYFPAATDTTVTCGPSVMLGVGFGVRTTPLFP